MHHPHMNIEALFSQKEVVTLITLECFDSYMNRPDVVLHILMRSAFKKAHITHVIICHDESLKMDCR